MKPKTKTNKSKKLPLSLVRKEFSPRSEMRLPLLVDIKNSMVFGTFLQTTSQFPGRSITLNFPEKSWNGGSPNNLLNYYSSFGSGTAYGKYTYGAVLRARLSLIMQNLETSAVHTGIVFVPPLQTISNNTPNDYSSKYQKSVFLGPTGAPNSVKTLTCVVDLPKLYRMSDQQYQTLPALWFSNGGAPSTVAYAYHQMYKLDGTGFSTGVNIKLDMQYDIQATGVNSNLTG